MIAPLLRSRRFLPLFVTQFLGALNDNLFKNALVVLALFQAGAQGPVLVAAAGGVFILPYLLFASIAGELAEAREELQVLREAQLAKQKKVDPRVERLYDFLDLSPAARDAKS